MKHMFKLMILLFLFAWANALFACCTEFDSMKVGSVTGRRVLSSWKGRNNHSKEKEGLGEERVVKELTTLGLEFLGKSKVEGNKGVDLIFWDTAAKTFLFHESKFDWGGSFRPRKNKIECPQGSVEWVKKKMGQMKTSTDPDTRETAKELSKYVRWVKEAFRTANVVRATGQNDYHTISNTGDWRVMDTAAAYLQGLIGRLPGSSFPDSYRIKPHSVGKTQTACDPRTGETILAIIRDMRRMRVG